jgi:hypothetical protein
MKLNVGINKMGRIKFYALGHLIACGVIVGCFASETKTLLPSHHVDPHQKMFNKDYADHNKNLFKSPSFDQKRESESSLMKEIEKISIKLIELEKDRDDLLKAYKKKDRNIELYIAPYDASIAALKRLEEQVKSGAKKGNVETEIYHILEEHFPQDDDF